MPDVHTWGLQEELYNDSVYLQVPTFDVNVRDGAMMTSLMWAAFHGKPEHIEKLTERGAGKEYSEVLLHS